ncbi:MAG: squalene synthase HpnC [Brachymonas sp.]|nr:squalene synthase HpnC [Brachymonas sp.]
MSRPPPPSQAPAAEPDNHPDTHYENFPVASWLCPAHIRPAVVTIYRFARTADDLADEGNATPQQRLADLAAYRQALQASCGDGGNETSAAQLRWPHVMQPLQAAVRQHSLPLQALHDLISAFERDVHHTATGHVYADWAELADYARLSANPVGRLMLHLYGMADAQSLAQSDAICTALQYYNFWQDISVDIARKRYYLPRHLCAPLGIDPTQPQRANTEQQAALMQRLLNHTDALMQQGLPLPQRLAAHPGQGNKLSALELQLVWQGGWRIGQKTRRLGAAAITQRPTLYAGDWGLIALRSLRQQMLD